MSKDKKKDVFDELVNNPTFIKEADDAWKNIDKLPSLCPHCNCMTKTIKSLCGKCGGSKNNTKWLTKTIESERERAIKGFITKMYGKRCKEYEEGCPTCDEWKLFDEYINKLT